MSNKIKQKDSIKNKLKVNFIIYITFAIIVFALSLLKKYSIINPNFSLIPFYIIIGILVLFTIPLLCIKCPSTKQIGTSMIMSMIGVFIFVAFGIAIDIRTKLIDFSKNATKVEALVYKEPEKKVTKHRDTCTNNIHTGHCKRVGDHWQPVPYYKIKYIYYLKYVVEDETYTSVYKVNENKDFENEQQANNYYNAKHKEGDYITIYYDNNNPENFKTEYSLGYGMVYIIELITIIYQCFYIIKYRKLIKDIKK